MHVGKKSQEKKSRKKSQIWVGKMSQENSHKHKIFFSTLLLEMDIIIFIITNIIQTIFVWVDVLHPDY